MTTEQIPIDKSTWGEGPWQTEPDRLEWEHAGLPCLAVRSHHGNWCGYAAVLPGHPWHGWAYQDTPEDLVVHGGLTYSDQCCGHICHVPKPGEPDNVWWFGFDCAHCWDVMPAIEARVRIFGDRISEDGASYKTLAYVQAETNRLAEQLHAADAVDPHVADPGTPSTRDKASS
jgi:hypothetical protein